MAKKKPNKITGNAPLADPALDGKDKANPEETIKKFISAVGLVDLLNFEYSTYSAPAKAWRKGPQPWKIEADGKSLEVIGTPKKSGTAVPAWLYESRTEALADMRSAADAVLVLCRENHVDATRIYDYLDFASRFHSHPYPKEPGIRLGAAINNLHLHCSKGPPPMPCRLTIENIDRPRDTAVVNLDGKPISTSATLAIILQKLISDKGRWVAGKILEQLAMCSRADREIKKLPGEIEQIIESEPAKGFRITIFD